MSTRANPISSGQRSGTRGGNGSRAGRYEGGSKLSSTWHTHWQSAEMLVVKPWINALVSDEYAKHPHFEFGRGYMTFTSSPPDSLLACVVRRPNGGGRGGSASSACETHPSVNIDGIARLLSPDIQGTTHSALTLRHRVNRSFLFSLYPGAFFCLISDVIRCFRRGSTVKRLA